MRVVGVVASFLVACSSPASAPDAGVPDDASADAGLPDAPLTTGTIQVTVRGGAMPAPIANSVVVFTDSVQTQVVETDAAGQASVVVTGPTSVTSIQYLNPTFVLARSILDAEPGDELVIHPRAYDGTVYPMLNVQLAVPTAQTYVCTPCSCQTLTTSTSFEVYGWCRQDQPTILVYSPDHTQYAAVTVAYDSTVGATVTLPAPSLPTPQYTGTFSNIPLRVTGLAFAFSDIAHDDVRFARPASSASGQVHGVRYQLPQFVTTFTNEHGIGEYQIAQTFLEPSTTGLTMDVSAELIPWLGVPTFTKATRTFAMPTAAPGADIDLSMASVAFTRVGGGSAVWELFQGTAKTFVLPDIPTSVVDMTPDYVYPTHEARLVDVSTVAGYAQARQDPYALMAGDGKPGDVRRMSAAPGTRP